MKKFLSIFLVLCMIVSILTAIPITANASTSGTYGENITWTLNDNGILTVSGIGDMSFEGQITHYPWYGLNIKEIIIENGITSISNYAFYNCTNLININIPNSVTSIGNHAFSMCTSLTSITIPNSVISIGPYAFYCCNLTNINIPDSVVSVDYSIFWQCSNLTNIYVDDDNQAYVSIDGALFNKDKTELIIYPMGRQDVDYTVPNSVTSIGPYAFYYCDNLTDIAIPNSVTSIGNSAFSHCGRLKNIIMPNNATAIGTSAFYACDDLKNISIPNGITEINSSTFYMCDSLISISIPNSVKFIYDRAFRYCDILTDVYYNGSSSEWNNIYFGVYNSRLTNATIHYNSSTADEKETLIPSKNNGYETNNRFGNGVSINVSGANGSISNATVSVGSHKTTTDSNGIAYFSDVELRKPYIVKVTAGGYFNKTSLETFYNNSKDITMLATTDNIYISSVFYGKDNYVYGDLINHNTVTIENTDTNKYCITANVDWGNNPEGSISLYGKNSKKSLAFTGNKLTSAIGTYFGAGESFQLIFKTNGKTYTKDLKLKTRALPEDIEIKLESEESGTIPSEFPFLGGKSFVFKLDLTEAINTSADVKIQDDKAVITMDYGDEDIKQQYANIFGDKAVKGTVGVKIEIPISDLSGGQWSGYITFKSGNKEKNHGTADYLGLATIDKTFWIPTPAGSIPTYMTLDLSASLNAEVGVEYKKPNWNLNGNITPSIKGRFSGGLGVAYDSFEVNVGPYGSASLKADVTLNPLSIEPKVTLDFGMQVTAKAWFINAKGELGLGKWEWPEKSRMMLMSLDTSDVQLIERDYEEYPNEFMPDDISLFSMHGTDSDVKILSNVFPSIQSRQVSANGKEILLFTNDNTERETQNGLTLFYSTKENDTWSLPKAVADDGTLDSSIDAEGEFVVWENTKQVLSADETNLTNVLSLSEIAVAKYNGSDYDTPIILTDNDIADFAPVISQNGENTVIAWLSNTESDIFSQTGTTNINYKIFDGKTWGETQIIDNVGSVTRIEVQYINDIPKIVYKIDDKVNMIDTSNNKAKTIYEGNVIQYTSSNDGVYVFTDDGKIDFISHTSKKSNIAENVVCVSIPQVVSNSNDIYLLWCESSDNGIKLCGIKNNGNDWSKKIDFISGEFDVVTPYAYLTDNQFSVSYLRRENMNNLSEEESMPDKFISDLYFSNIIETQDLSLEDVNYSDKITYVVKNVGTEDVNEFNVTITQNDTILTTEVVSEVIKAGDTITKELNIANFDATTEAELTISLNDTEDYNITNNSVIFNSVGSDPEVLSAKMVVNENESYIEAEIVNSGLVADCSVVAELRKSSIDGEVIYSETYADVLPKEKILFKYDITETDCDYYVCLTAQNDEKKWNNFGLCAKTNNSNEVMVDVQSSGNGTVFGGGQYSIDSNVTVSATPDNGYTFSGWYFNDTLVSKDTNYTFKAECDVNLYAKFTKKSTGGNGGGGGVSYYIVKFETNGGNTIANQKLDKNSTVTEPSTPTKEGYAFNGWYIDKELTTAYDFSEKVTKDFTLYAKWIENSKVDEPTTSEWINPFIDVKTNDWFYDSVKYVNENGIMNGISGNEFAPNSNLTRAMFVTILYRIEGTPETDNSSFKDVEIGSWYEKAVAWASENGIVNGISGDEFAPNDSITREQMAAILYRYTKYKDNDTTIGENTNILSFDDLEDVSEYAVSAMQWAVGSGLINGETGSTINPKNNSTRAQAATVFMRMLTK